jgi:hypothetical protein
MSTMSDILNPTFLMCLGIILISIACLVIYFENKLRDHNHKMSSMLGLVASLTDEVNHTKKFLLHVTNNVPQNQKAGLTDEPLSQQLLIPVSDDDDDDDDDNDDSDSDSDEDDDDEVEDTINSLTPTLYDINKTKILKIDITPHMLYTENVDENLEELNLISVSESESESGSESDSDVDEYIDSKLPDHSTTDFSNATLKVDIGAQLIDDIITTELKTIDITHLDNLSIVDYKKLSVPKLKIIVGEKGLASDCSKMKKTDLLKLLETS